MEYSFTVGDYRLVVLAVSMPETAEQTCICGAFLGTTYPSLLLKCFPLISLLYSQESCEMVLQLFNKYLKLSSVVKGTNSSQGNIGLNMPV